MTTTTAKGRITGLIGLTCIATYAAQKGDPVMLTGDYQVGLADGTKPVVGFVSIQNVTRSGGVYPSAQVPGDCTVEARGYMVRTMTAAVTVVAGADAYVTAAGAVTNIAAGNARIGIFLNGATATNLVDVLVQ